MNIWIIYLCSTLGNLKIFAQVSILMISSVLIIFTAIVINDVYYGLNSITELTKIPSIKICIIALIISIIMAIVIPSDEMAYTMYLSSFLTKENVDIAIETITNAVNTLKECM